MLTLRFYCSSFLLFMLKCSQYRFSFCSVFCYVFPRWPWVLGFQLTFFFGTKIHVPWTYKDFSPKKWQGAFLEIRQSYKLSAQWEGHSGSIETRIRHSLKVPEIFVMTPWWYTNQNSRARYNAFHIEPFTLHDMRFWWCILGCWFRIDLPKCAVRVPNRNARDEILGSEVLLVYPWILI